MLNFIATPIGNLNDISLRAIEVIRSSDYLYAEDTRNTQKLLNFINIKIKCKSFHEHNEDETSKKIIRHLKSKKNVSIVSDAGTPSISDPGYKLIQMCIENSLKYTLIPGASSIISSLVMSGLPTDKFSFYGYIPKKQSDQDKFFESLINEDKTSILFESPKRILKSIQKLTKYLNPNQKISICKEMTKLHENIIRGQVKNILSIIKENNFNLRGEIVVAIEGRKRIKKHIQIDKKIKEEYLTKLSAADSAKLISLISGENKRDIYKKLIEK